MTNIHQQRIRETLHSAAKIQAQELAPVLATYYTAYTFTVACQQLQQLADIFSGLSVAIQGFVMEADWQRRADETAAQDREAHRKATSPQGETLLSVAQVADLLKVRKAKVYDMIKSGNLPATDINANMDKRPLLRIRASDVP